MIDTDVLIPEAPYVGNVRAGFDIDVEDSASGFGWVVDSVTSEGGTTENGDPPLVVQVLVVRVYRHALR